MFEHTAPSQTHVSFKTIVTTVPPTLSPVSAEHMQKNVVHILGYERLTYGHINKAQLLPLP